MPSESFTPFRWDLRKRQSLGGLLEGEVAACYDGFVDDLRGCAARVLSFAGDRDLYFIGRSPESLFDYLSGVLLDTSWSERLHLVHLSLRGHDPDRLLGTEPGNVEHLRAYLTRVGLEPELVLRHPRCLAFVDLVASGSTLGNLTKLLETWSGERRLEWRAVHRKIRYVGVTWEKKTSPNTWRWQQNCAWVQSVPEATIKNVSIPWRLWDYLGNYQAKTTCSYFWRYWGAPEAANPPRDARNIEALRLAFRLFERGRTKQERDRFAAELGQRRAVRERWFRAVLAEVRGIARR
jgi:hypothetical protein